MADSRELSSFEKSRSEGVFQTDSCLSLYQRALALHQQNRLYEAETLYRQVLDIDSSHHGALHFLGMVHFIRGEVETALQYIQKSLEVDSTIAVYHNNLGVVFKEQRRYQEAYTAFEKAVALDPKYPDALSNLGLVSVSTGLSPHLTEHYYRSALKLRPDHVDALRHYSSFLVKQELYTDALPLVERLIQVSPKNAGTLLHLARLYGDCGKINRAKQSFQKAALLPGGQPVWFWEHLWYSPLFFENENQIDEFWQSLRRELDSALAENPLFYWPTLVHEGFTHSFHLPHHNRCCRDILEKYAKLFIPSFPFKRPTYKPGTKIRVGFLVTPGHEGGFLRLTTGLIEQLDPEKFEVAVIYAESSSLSIRDKYKRSDILHVTYSSGFEEAVQSIRDAHCDVIYYWKVAADTWSFFLPMCHLAPVQCTSWSTHGTSGVPQIDYFYCMN